MRFVLHHWFPSAWETACLQLSDLRMEAFFPVKHSHYTLMPRASDVPCIRGFVSGSSSEECAHWKLHIGVSMIAGTLLPCDYPRLGLSRKRDPQSHCGWATAFSSLWGTPKPEVCRWTPSRVRESMAIVQLKVKYPQPLSVRYSSGIAFCFFGYRTGSSLSLHGVTPGSE